VSSGHNICCLNGTTGNKIWNYTLPSGDFYPVFDDLRSDGRKEVIVSVSPFIYCLDATTGTSIWNNTIGGNARDQLIAVDLFGDGKLEVVAESTGNIV
jgi:outer membrane protein assembly factor BamB